jgi:ribosomal-protein-serine acetyltransferase
MATWAMELWPADEVRTERFVLRPYAVSDAEEMYAAIGDSQAELIPWMPWALELGTIEARRELLQGWIDDLVKARSGAVDGMMRGEVVYGIWDGDRLVGGTGIHDRVGEKAREIGYWTRTAHASTGVATEISRALTTEILRNAEMDYAVINCDIGNRASAAIPVKLGYELVEETFRLREAPSEQRLTQTRIMRRANWKV